MARGKKIIFLRARTPWLPEKNFHNFFRFADTCTMSRHNALQVACFAAAKRIKGEKYEPTAMLLRKLRTQPFLPLRSGNNQYGQKRRLPHQTKTRTGHAGTEIRGGAGLRPCFRRKTARAMRLHAMPLQQKPPLLFPRRHRQGRSGQNEMRDENRGLISAE